MSHVRRCAAILPACCLALLASAAEAGVTREGNFRIEYAGSSIGPDTSLDQAVISWMTAWNIPAAQLAVRRNGTLIFSHAYTMGTGRLVTIANLFRLASVSKMLVTASYSQLLAAGVLTGNERVYPYLGITAPLLPGQTPDPRSKQITVEELYAHTSGLPGSGAGDPLFTMRDIEVALGQEPLTAAQFAQYLYGVALNSNPGSTYTYSNVGYFLLGQVIAQASGRDYASYVQSSLLAPLHLTNWIVSPTSQAQRDKREIVASDPYTGPDVFDLKPNAPQRPFDYEGGDIVWEVAAAPADFATNAESVSAFIHTWNVYGLGGRAYDYARTGYVPGVVTWAESLDATHDFSLLLNSGPELSFSSVVIQSLRTAIGGL